MKRHRIQSGIRGGIEREWYTVWTLCGLRLVVEPPSRRPKRATVTDKRVECGRCLNGLRSMRKVRA